ncbi:hypothetical protein R8Z50_12375 [Longispora sp. K20-0274]|uniref:leucine-rich repeat domain-containing protein n=1 Tax=Longispora sp. K20-0274 TaxID=3088255 RepID=UPI00399BBDA1
MPSSAAPESLSYADADARLSGALSAVFEGDYDEVLFFDGDLTVDGDLLEPRDGEDLIVVTGDLTVTGRIALYADKPGLFVAGRTEAETLEGGEAEICVNDGAITHLIYGEHDRGAIWTGTVDTPWVIEFDHMMAVNARGARWVDAYGDSDDADFGRDDIADAFVPEVVDPEDGGLRVDEFLDRLRAGLPVLRPGALTATEATVEHTSRVREDRVEHLDLTGRKLRAFPAEVLAMPWLRTLILDDNRIAELPEELGTLTRLEHLSVRDCGLTTLPDSIGDLAGLRVLRVAGNADWTARETVFALPAAVGRLAALEELDVSRLSVPTGAATGYGGKRPAMTPFALPDVLGGLVALRRLVADGTNVVFPASAHGLTGVEEVSMAGGDSRYLRTFPEAVTTFANLRRLDLSDNLFDAVPDSLLRLTRLEELDLGNSLGLVRDPLPDLGRLPALRVLGLGAHPGHKQVPERGHAVLRQLFGMALTALEELRIDRWGADDQRGELTAEDLAGIGAFRRLRTVDLSFNRLRDLPAEFDTLPDLVAVDLGHNKLPDEVRDRITAAHPAAAIDFRT